MILFYLGSEAPSEASSEVDLLRKQLLAREQELKAKEEQLKERDERLSIMTQRWESLMWYIGIYQYFQATFSPIRSQV